MDGEGRRARREVDVKAAVIASPGLAPTYSDYVLPPSSVGSAVDLMAAALHPEVRFERNHHARGDPTYPRVPGLDGVGYTSGGTLRYFLLADGATGSMADRTIVDLRHSTPLDENCDVVAVAAALYPALSCWEALRDRMDFRPGQTVLVLGADDADGQLSVQLARLLGAGSVIAACRDENADLLQLGATETVGLTTLGDDLLHPGTAGIDVVLDHLGESPTSPRLAEAILCRRPARGMPLPWFRAAPSTGVTHELETPRTVEELPVRLVERDVRRCLALDLRSMTATLCAELERGGLRIDSRVFPLAAVDQAWARYDRERRNVLVADGDDVVRSESPAWMQRRRLDWFL